MDGVVLGVSDVISTYSTKYYIIFDIYGQRTWGYYKIERK